MILYVNGDSHTAAAEAVNPHAFAEDDGRLKHLGRLPHPDNLKVSWGRVLADITKCGLQCDAESASSNDRIIRTTRKWLSKQTDLKNLLVIIQWSTWERQEWLDSDGTYYQVNASGVDEVPESMKDRYKQFVIDVDWNKCVAESHAKIWEFHQELKSQNIKHVFFNGNNDFGKVTSKQDWGVSYIDPYDPKMTYSEWLKNNGYQTVSPESWHFGQDAHAAWAKFMLQYVVNNKLVS